MDWNGMIRNSEITKYAFFLIAVLHCIIRGYISLHYRLIINVVFMS